MKKNKISLDTNIKKKLNLMKTNKNNNKIAVGGS